MTDSKFLIELYIRLRYDSTNGVLYRKGGTQGVISGKPLGTRTTNGKLQTKFKGTRYNVDALIWCMETGLLPVNFLIHLDGDNANSKIGNLLDVTQSQFTDYRQCVLESKQHEEDMKRLNAQLKLNLNAVPIEKANDFLIVGTSCI